MSEWQYNEVKNIMRNRNAIRRGKESETWANAVRARSPLMQARVALRMFKSKAKQFSDSVIDFNAKRTWRKINTEEKVKLQRQTHSCYRDWHTPLSPSPTRKQNIQTEIFCLMVDDDSVSFMKQRMLWLSVDYVMWELRVYDDCISEK